MEQTITNEPVVHYDAFISYRHVERDAFLAKELHTMLEHYHIPAKIQKSSGKKRIARVFRDQEELPLSANLTSNIETALKNSDYLIVICSPESLESIWVQREVHLFMQFHDRSHILTLLTAGEPEEAFPPVLCFSEETVTLADGSQAIRKVPVEPLAADVRGANDRERKKKLKRELLRLLAPMLSCTYDDLRQRHREYTMRRTLAASCLVAALAVAFMLYAFRQASLIASQYQESRRSQTRYLAQISGELLGQGDRMGALQTALAITPDDPDAAEPVVPEQLYALNSALYSYRHTNSLDFLPDCTAELEGEAVSGEFSPEGNYYLCLDKSGTVCILDGKQGERIRTIRPQDFAENRNQPFEYCHFLSEDQIVLASSASIVLLELQEEQPLRILALPEETLSGNLLFTAKQQRAAVISRTQLLVYDLSTGKCLAEKSFDDMLPMTLISGSAALSPDGAWLAVALGRDCSAEEGDSTGILLLSVADGQTQMLSDEDSRNLMFTDDSHLVALHYFFPEPLETLAESEKEILYPALYDLKTKKRLWKGAGTEIISLQITSGFALYDMTSDEKDLQILAAYIKGRLLLLDPETGETIQERNYPSDVVGIEKYDSSRILAGLADGTIQISTLKFMETVFEAGSINNTVKGFAFSAPNLMTVQIPETGRKLVLSRILQDETMEELVPGSGSHLSGIDYYTVPTPEGSRVFRCICCDLLNAVKYILYEAGSDQELFRIAAATEDVRIQNVHIGLRGQTPLLCYTESNIQGGTSEFCAVDLNEGRELFRCDLSGLEINTYQPFVYSASMEWAVVSTYDTFFFAEITDDGFQLTDRSIPGVQDFSYSSSALLSSDDQYLLIISETDYPYCDLRVWDIANGQWVSFDGNPVYSRINGSDSIVPGRQKPLAAIYNEQGSIDILNLSTGTLQCSIPFGGYQNRDFEFYDGDRFLITYGDENILSLWDLETGRMLMQESYATGFGASILTDGSNRYFGLKTSAFGYSASGMSDLNLRIYSVDENHHFYPYADIERGYASFEAQEILCTSLDEKLYSTHFYSYPELKKQAEESLQGKALSDTERRKYFISD